MLKTRAETAAFGSAYHTTNGSDEIDGAPDDGLVHDHAAAAWQMLSRMLPMANWTAQALAGQVQPAVPWDRRVGTPGPDVYDRLARVLYRRRKQHVLVTGLKGVGKTSVVQEFARRAAAGGFPFLENHEFLWIDCSNIGPEDSRACLETILTACGDRGRLVLCLDGLDALLKRPLGGTNKPLLQAACERHGLQIVGILSRWAYHDLVAGDSDMLDRFTRIELDEPSEEMALEIARNAARGLELDYAVRIDDRVVERCVALASTYLLGESHPAKVVRILERVCDEADYERTQSGRLRAAIELVDVIRVLAETTGIPPETLSGDGGSVDLESALRDRVVGQDEAVEAVANELRLIKAGLTEPGKPASVLLFAGMTGVGKTELAKRVAELYSTSKRLQIYSMGNFTEPHSVSAIMGVPPGYVGHDQGGRLINELNSDPYSVFLLDEAEKCHPNIWKPFLNLFDEGWIADQRGVRAYADRAIFILTTNAGDREISQMSRTGRSETEISERVKTVLSKIRHERSSQPVFTPQFLSRLKRTIVFRPLDERAMIGITRRLIRHMSEMWEQKREKTIEVPEELIEFLGRRSHVLNEKSGGQEGGRIVRKLISDVLETAIQREATLRADDYRCCRRVVVRFAAKVPDVENAASPQLAVVFSE